MGIDPFFRSFFGIRGYGWARRIAHREVRKASRGQVIWIEQLGRDAPRAPEALPHLPVDFIFIDGDHSFEGLEGDWLNWRDHISPGGIVALHDSQNRGGCGSEAYTRDIILKDSAFTKVTDVDSLTIIQRR